MDFINASIPVDALPAAEDVDLQPVQPSYKSVLLTEWLISAVVLVAIAATVIILSTSLRASFGWLIVAGVTVLICAYYYFSIQKAFPYLAFAVREKDVMMQRGWLVRRVKMCPFNRIQNCSVQSGPLERRHKLATLIIFTAGSDGADLRIPGLLQEEAERLRHFILDKIHTEPDEAA